MALTLNNFSGAETNGQDELAAVTGTVSLGTTSPRTGTYYYSIAGGGAAGSDKFFITVTGIVASAGAGKIFGVGFRTNNTSSATSLADEILSGYNASSGGALNWRVVYNPSTNTLLLRDSGVATLVTVSSALTANTWHYIEVYVEETNSGAYELFLDGVSKGSGTGADLLATAVSTVVQSANHTNADTTFDYDDYYILTGATASSERWGDAKVKAYQKTDGGATSLGNTLDAGTWALASERPLDNSAGHIATYSSSGFTGGMQTDSGTRSGPSGDTDIATSSTIKGIKGIFNLSRGTGGGTTHSARLGNSTDGLTDTTVTLSTSFGTFFVLSESATVVPTTSEYAQIGMGTSGAQDINAGDLWAMVVWVPPAGGTTNNVSGTATWRESAVIARSAGLTKNATFKFSASAVRAASRSFATTARYSGAATKSTLLSPSATHKWSATAIALKVRNVLADATLKFSAAISRQASLVQSATYKWTAAISRGSALSVVASSTYRWAADLAKQLNMSKSATYRWSAAATALKVYILSLSATYKYKNTLATAIKVKLVVADATVKFASVLVRQASLIGSAAYTWAASLNKLSAIGVVVSSTVRWSSSLLKQTNLPSSALYKFKNSLADVIKVKLLSFQATYLFRPTAIRQIGVLASSSYKFSANVVRAVSASFNALYTWTASAVATFISGGGSTFPISASATLKASAAAVKSATLNFSASYRWTAAIVKAAAKSFSTSFKETAAAVRSTSIAKSATYTWSATSSAIKVFILDLSASIKYSAKTVRSASLALASSVSLSASSVLASALNLAATVSFSASATVSAAVQAILLSLSATWSLAASTTMTFTEAVATVAAFFGEAGLMLSTRIRTSWQRRRANWQRRRAK